MKIKTQPKIETTSHFDPNLIVIVHICNVGDYALQSKLQQKINANVIDK